MISKKRLAGSAAALALAATAAVAGGVAAASEAEAVEYKRVVFKVWSTTENRANVETCPSLFNCREGSRLMPYRVVKYVPRDRLYQVSLWADTFNSPRWNTSIWCEIRVGGVVKSHDGGRGHWTAFCAL